MLLNSIQCDKHFSFVIQNHKGYGYVRKGSVTSILSMRNLMWTLGVGGGLGGACAFLSENMENFNNLFKNFNILKSSIHSRQNSSFL